MSEEKHFDAEMSKGHLIQGILVGVISVDKKERFACGTVVTTSSVKGVTPVDEEGYVYIGTRNSVYRLKEEDLTRGRKNKLSQEVFSA